DVERKRPVWNYVGGTAADGSPDVRHWFVARHFPSPTGNLEASKLPGPEGEQGVKLADDPNQTAGLKKGATVSLQLEFGGRPRDSDKFRRDVVAALTDRLRGSGYNVADNAPVRLVIKVDDKGTGNTISFRKMFARPGDNPFRTL